MFAVERDSSSRFSRVPAGTAIAADSGNLYTVAWGVAVLQSNADIHTFIQSALDTLPFSSETSFVLARGDTVIHAGHIPESGEIIMIRGRAYVGGEFWHTAEDAREFPKLADSPALLLHPLRQEWWVHVTVGSRKGWIDAYRSKLKGSDACE